MRTTRDDLTNFVSQNNIDVTVQGYWKTASSAFSSSNEIAGAVLQTTVEYCSRTKFCRLAKDTDHCGLQVV